MNKLLSANFARLKKSKCFWACLLFLVGYTSLIQISTWYSKVKYDLIATPDYGMVNFFVVAGITQAIFCSLFLGTEYSDGTIRNKLIVGHSRPSIYLANLITCSAGGILMSLAGLAAGAITGLPLLGGFAAPLSLLATILTEFLLVTAYSALFTLLAMSCQSKAAVAVINLLLAFLLLFAGAYINARLNEPETYPDYTMSEDGEMAEEGEIENPNYLRGTERQVYEFLNDFLPGSQSQQMAGLAPVEWLWPVSSGLIVIAATGAGILIFRKKDLK